MKTFFIHIISSVSIITTVATGSFAIEVCPEPYDPNTWNGCVGELTLLEGMTPVNTGDFYEGEWQNGKPDGQGKVTFKDGTGYYHGSLKNGQAHGDGVLANTSGYKYVGEWQNDKRNGKGIETRSGVEQYIGDFKDDERHGEGELIFSNGAKLSVTWVKGLADGYGIHTHKDGTQYVGQFKDNNYHGQGSWTHANGNNYTGNFVSGNTFGKGRFTWGISTDWHGQVHTGQFKNNLEITGYGIREYANGGIEEGYWENGKLTHSTGSPLKFGFNSLPKDYRVQIQTRLADLRLYNSTIDGLYGPNTENALTSFNRTRCNNDNSLNARDYLSCVVLDEQENVTQLFANILSPNTNTKQKKDFTVLDALAAFAIGAAAVNHPNQTQGFGAVHKTACFKKSEYTSGFNKICNYDCIGSAYAMTIGSTALCPITVNR